MTACPRYPDDEIVLRYVTSDLAEPELATFEDHLFACDECLGRVQRYQAAQQGLAGRALPPVPTVVSSASDDAQASAAPRALPWWVISAAAASLLLSVGAWSVWMRGTGTGTGTPAPSAAVHADSSPTSAPAVGPNSMALRVAVLAMVTPPPYLPITTRGAASNRRLAEAMQSYATADWSAASRALSGIDTPEAQFYRGIADLMRGDAPGAITSLEVVRRSGRQPYARESLFYLGKAALQRGDVSAARASLTAARDAEAGPRGEAARLLTSLDELGRQ